MSVSLVTGVGVSSIGLPALGVALWVALLVPLVRMTLMAARMHQIEEYEVTRFFHWSRRRAWLAPRALWFGAWAPVYGALASNMFHRGSMPGILAGGCIGSLGIATLWRPLPAKKPLAYTSRMRRLLGAALGLEALYDLLVVLLLLHASAPLALGLGVLVLLVLPGAVTLLLALASLMLEPIETLIRQGFVRRAARRIKALDPLVIGIAGSYGKTSTKNIVAHLLASSMPTLPTPKSYNTLMGITRTINETLEESHRAFVVEMDAYAHGEIASICRLVRPSFGILTAVGPQHLERFRTIDAIGDALYELFLSLPAGAPAIMYCGDVASRRLAERAAQQGLRVIRYGLEGDDEALDVTASRIELTQEETFFTWRWAARHLEERVSIPLLGAHNILNTSAALAIVACLDLSLERAVEEARLLEPTPHRLQRIPNSNGITIIDDAYNANPVGIHNGLDVLERMAGNGKILVTPGLVELGPIEEEENRRLGQHAARICDRVILVGARQTVPIRSGLGDEAYPEERLTIVETLEEVTASLGRIARPGDVVLFANDLPDVYLELS